MTPSAPTAPRSVKPAAKPREDGPLTIKGVIAQAEKEEAARKKRPVNVARQKSRKTSPRKSR
jgi:hypothetical protein